MKKIQTLFMALICMISFTVTAHTAKLEQKQKTEFVKEVSSQSYNVCVNYYQVASVLMDVTAEPSDMNVVRFKNVTESYNHLVIVADVGWRKSFVNHKKIAYKEKVLSSKDLYYKNKNSLLTNLIRKNNPFRNEMVFIYSNRNC